MEDKKVRYINIAALSYESALRILKDGFNMTKADILAEEPIKKDSDIIGYRFTVEDKR